MIKINESLLNTITARAAIKGIMDGGPYKIILSVPSLADAEFKKINIIKKGEELFQAEKLTLTQAFHENISRAGLVDFLFPMLRVYEHLNAFCEDGKEYSIKVTSKGKILFNKRKIEEEMAPKKTEFKTPETKHNRVKNYVIPEGSIVPPLVDMGIFTRDGTVVSSMYDKFKQINRFLEIIDDVYSSDPIEPINILDLGCGKSYLTFIVYYYFTEIKKVKTNILGLDLKHDVIKNCQETAKKYNYNGLKFITGDIADYNGDFSADMLITLHACDVATDLALYYAVKKDITMIFSAPCCQHELNEQIDTENYSILTRYGVLKERLSTIMTDAIRGNLLTYMGYKTQIMEFVDLGHTPKNIMIRAIKKNISHEKRREAYNEVLALTSEFNLKPTLLKLLKI